MSEVRSFPSQMGPAPANLRRFQATAQNTLELQDGEPVVVNPPVPGAGPHTWVWQILNVGPGIVYIRWDGNGYAAALDENSLHLPAGAGFADIPAGVITFACDGATTVTFAADNTPK